MDFTYHISLTLYLECNTLPSAQSIGWVRNWVTGGLDGREREREVLKPKNINNNTLSHNNQMQHNSNRTTRKALTLATISNFSRNLLNYFPLLKYKANKLSAFFFYSMPQKLR